MTKFISHSCNRDGHSEFEATAAALAILCDRKTKLTVRLEATRRVHLPPGALGSVTAITLALPEGVSPPDPRLSALGERVMELMAVPDHVWQRLQRLKAEHGDGR